jgi:hypothetical protein
MYGDIAGTVFNKQGGTIGRARFMHIAYSPGMKFNLCSLSKLYQGGWEI